MMKFIFSLFIPNRKWKLCIYGVLFASFGILYMLSDATMSKGFRDGRVFKASEKRDIPIIGWKTIEASMSTSAHTSDLSGKKGQSGGNAWNFSIPSKELFEEFNKIDTKRRVRIHYEEKYIVFWWIGKTDYLYVGYEYLDNVGYSQEETEEMPPKTLPKK